MIVNLRRVDTTPGAPGNNPFTPPAGFAGDEREYLLFMEQRYRELDHGQRIAVMVRRAVSQNTYPLEYSGPYAGVARRIVAKLVAHGGGHARGAA